MTYVNDYQVSRTKLRAHQEPRTRLLSPTKNPEHKTDLNVCHENVGGSEGGLEQVVNLVAVRHLVVVVCEEICCDVVRDGVGASVEAKRGRRQQDEEAHV